MNDEDDFILQNAKIAIIGLGLMGGSFALALKGKCAELLAVVPRQTTRELALRLNIVSQADEDPAKILPQADVIVLSTPIPAIFDWLARLPEYVHQPCVVIDMGSTKQAIVEAMGKLPEQFHAIGGHPICGKENLTLENAEATLYHNAPFVLTPLPRTSARASAAAFQIINVLGANPIWIDAAMHDRILAATSHLPFLLASALVLATPTESAPLVGPGFRSSSRLASTPSSMMMGVMQTNRQNILDAISRLKVNLDLLEQALQSEDSEKIKSVLDEACAKHKKFL
jgi:prephenate dehydrogenase